MLAYERHLHPPLHTSRTMRPYLRREKRPLRLFSAFSPAGPKGCSKDDERVLKGCLCLCHPSHNLFFRRKHLYGTILFPKFSAKVILFFDICKFCTPVLSIFYIFYLFFRTLRPLARNCIPVISSIVRLYHRPSLSSFPRDLIPLITINLEPLTIHLLSAEDEDYMSHKDNPMDEIVYFLSSLVATRKVFVRCSNKGRFNSFSLRLIS